MKSAVYTLTDKDTLLGLYNGGLLVNADVSGWSPVLAICDVCFTTGSLYDLAHFVKADSCWSFRVIAYAKLSTGPPVGIDVCMYVFLCDSIKEMDTVSTTYSVSLEGKQRRWIKS